MELGLQLLHSNDSRCLPSEKAPSGMGWRQMLSAGVHHETVVEERLTTHMQAVLLQEVGRSVEWQVTEGLDVGEDTCRHTRGTKGVQGESR